jgi:hypothetical protein
MCRRLRGAQGRAIWPTACRRVRWPPRTRSVNGTHLLKRESRTVGDTLERGAVRPIPVVSAAEPAEHVVEATVASGIPTEHGLFEGCTCAEENGMGRCGLSVRERGVGEEKEDGHSVTPLRARKRRSP